MRKPEVFFAGSIPGCREDGLCKGHDGVCRSSGKELVLLFKGEKGIAYISERGDRLLKNMWERRSSLGKFPDNQ